MRTAKIEIYQDVKGAWRWRLRAINGRITAVGGEGYCRKTAVLRAVRRVQATMGDIRFQAKVICDA